MGALRHRLTLALILALTLAVVTAAGALADVRGKMGKDKVRLNIQEFKERQQIKAEIAEAKAKAAKKAVHFEYASVANCPGNTPDTPRPDDLCTSAALACAGNTPAQGLGPSVRIFRRVVDGTGNPRGGWEDRGITCFPDQAPNPTRPVLTMQLVLAAFHDTKFATPSVAIQPKGNVTLVTLPTYFQLVWPQAGFQPREVDRPSPARMAGFSVEIRPTLKSVNYVYGDGTSSGPTESLGGPYPEGDITKAYAETGTFPVRADVTYGGQFRVEGGGWIDIPDQVVVRGTPEPLAVKTAKARLVSH
jgi:hypothetical protein